MHTKRYAVQPPSPTQSRTPLVDDETPQRRSRIVRFADELGGQLVNTVEVECLKAEFAPELWSKSLCPLWSCSECTLVNEKADALACILCGAPRWENDPPMEYLDRIALRISAGSRSKEMRQSARSRPGTPARRSSPSSAHVQHTSEGRVAVEKPEKQILARSKVTGGRNAKMGGPQVSASSSAVRASSATPVKTSSGRYPFKTSSEVGASLATMVGRHGKNFGEVLSSNKCRRAASAVGERKKDFAEQRVPHRQETEWMLDSMYRRAAWAQSLATKVPLKTPSPVRRMDLDTFDLPEIGSQANKRTGRGSDQQMHEQLGRDLFSRRPGSSSC